MLSFAKFVIFLEKQVLTFFYSKHIFLDSRSLFILSCLSRKAVKRIVVLKIHDIPPHRMHIDYKDILSSAH